MYACFYTWCSNGRINGVSGSGGDNVRLLFDKMLNWVLNRIELQSQKHKRTQITQYYSFDNIFPFNRVPIAMSYVQHQASYKDGWMECITIHSIGCHIHNTKMNIVWCAWYSHEHAQCSCHSWMHLQNGCLDFDALKVVWYFIKLSNVGLKTRWITINC